MAFDNLYQIYILHIFYYYLFNINYFYNNTIIQRSFIMSSSFLKKDVKMNLNLILLTVKLIYNIILR